MNKIILAVMMMVVPCSVWAQDGDGHHKHETYAKAGIFHNEGRVDWASYLTNGLNVEIETYFNKEHLLISGWSIGYRKDELRSSDYGHMLIGKVFRTIKVSRFGDLKVGGGAEWGVPAHGFDRTKSTPDGYVQVFLKRNSNVPKIGTGADGAWYPFTEMTVSKRKKFFMVEAGLRASLMSFGSDEYRITDGGEYSFVEDNKTRIIPSIVVNIGFLIKK